MQKSAQFFRGVKFQKPYVERVSEFKDNATVTLRNAIDIDIDKEYIYLSEIEQKIKLFFYI